MAPAWRSTAADFGKGWSAEHDGLRVELRDPKRNGSGFTVTFALRNVSAARVDVYQRWNSWGAHAWRLAIVGADGSHVVAGNPERIWHRNGPTAVSIQPGKELVFVASVQTAAALQTVSGAERFVANGHLAFPLRVRGVFDSRPQQNPEPKVSLDGKTTINSKRIWAGVIGTDWIDVK